MGAHSTVLRRLIGGEKDSEQHNFVSVSNGQTRAPRGEKDIEQSNVVTISRRGSFYDGARGGRRYLPHSSTSSDVHSRLVGRTLYGSALPRQPDGGVGQSVMSVRRVTDPAEVAEYAELVKRRG